jgi:hypothetical protein
MTFAHRGPARVELRPRLVLAAGCLLFGCSTMTEGNMQRLAVSTNPEAAHCELVRGGFVVGIVDPTPGAVMVQKTKDPITYVCSKEGYQTATHVNKSDAAAATFGNILVGGLVGWGIDSVTGSDNKYESELTLTLPKN